MPAVGEKKLFGTSYTIEGPKRIDLEDYIWDGANWIHERSQRAKEILSPKVEIVSSPRLIDREHLRRDFQSEIDNLETVLHHLKYMKSEI